MKTAEDIVKDNKYDIISVPHDQTVQHACEIMVNHKVGAILVTQNDEYVGIWSERDLLRNITIGDFNPRNLRVGEYMTTPLQTVSYDTILPKLQDMFLGLFVRHLLVEKGGDFIGIISIGDALRASLLDKDQQFKALNSFCSWEYYENWKWGRKKKK